jgi:hypothetical protein
MAHAKRCLVASHALQLIHCRREWHNSCCCQARLNPTLGPGNVIASEAKVSRTCCSPSTTGSPP